MVKVMCAVNNEQKYEDYLKKSLTEHRIMCAEIMQTKGEEQKSIFLKYNHGIEQLLSQNSIGNDDVICFIHEDVSLLDPFFKNKIQHVFDQKRDVGVLGVVGSKKLNEKCAWWMNDSKDLRGHLQQENGAQSYHLVKGSVGFFDDLVCVDGFFFAVRGELLLNGLRFDSENFDGYDFYDLDICFKVLEMGYKVAVADIFLLHSSPGNGAFKPSWNKQKDIFTKKWISKGKNFPITKEDFNVRDFENENIEEVVL